MIGIAFDIPFAEQLEYFDSKGYAISPESWRDIWQGANARAFTVARVTRMDVLVDIREALTRAIDEGITFEQFQSDISKTLEQKGWLAPKGEDARVVMPDGTTKKRLTGWRLRTIYQTNLGTSYQVGRYKQMEDVKAARPYWQYRTAGDVSVRPTHQAHDGKVYHADHPFWDRWYPPNGFNCRCYVKTLSARQMEARGLTEETAGTDVLPDEGWQYNPGKEGLDAWEPELDRYPPELVRNYQEMTY